MRNDLLETIKDYLSHITVKNSLDRFNMCAAVYGMLNESPDSSAGFAFFMENVDSIESDCTKDVKLEYSQADIERLKKQLVDVVDAIFEKLLKSNLLEKVFYDELWKALTKSYIFDSAESIIFAIYFIVIDTRIPYFYIPLENEMSDAKFKDITKRNHKDIEKIRYIITSDQFTQWTTQAAALLKVLDEKQKDDRTVIMAHVLKVMDTAKQTRRLSSSDIPEELLQRLRQELTRD